MFPNVHCKPPPARLWTIPTRPTTGSQGEEISTFLSTLSPQEAAESNEIIPQPPFLQTRQAQSPQLLLIGHAFQPFHQLYRSPLDAFKDLNILPLDAFEDFNILPKLWKVQNHRQYSSWGHTNTKYNGTITSFDQLVLLHLMHPVMWYALLAARARCWLLLSLHDLQNVYNL